MGKNTEREPRIKTRWRVYLTKGRRSFFSKSYKTERGAWAAVERLNKKYGHLSYDAEIKTVEKVI